MNQDLVQGLFETDALRVSPADQPFWYTSGKLGPLYINTHFLYGSEEEANALLAAIEEAAAGDRLEFAPRIAALTLAQYDKSPVYRGVVDALAQAARGLEFDFISGGERRDFFFSLPVARRLGLPHLSIFKDLDTVYQDAAFGRGVAGGQAGLSGKTALHIVDLVTVASSYTRAWLPALRGLGADIRDTLAVIDRRQSGAEILAGEGVRLHSLIQVEDSLLEAARRMGKITAPQAAMIQEFLTHPEDFTPDFLAAHPDFLAGQIAQGGKAAERARLCIENGYDKVPPAC